MDGILNVNKPPGMTSYSVVALVKRLSGERRVGHAGTLDPDATGVLPICLGQATRIIEFLFDNTKVYRAQIQLGVTTDTYDASGRVTRLADASAISRESVESALATFKGVIPQKPPMYSAVKHHGKPLYELARAGISVERKTRQAKIISLELISWQPPEVTLEVECGKGTYIRSLAHDLGEVLGCGASLKNLIRLRCGPFAIKDALSLSELEDAFKEDNWQEFLYPPDFVLMNYPALCVSDDNACTLRHGVPLALPEKNEAEAHVTGNLCRVYTGDGCFLGLVRFNPEKGQWQPEKIFR